MSSLGFNNVVLQRQVGCRRAAPLYSRRVTSTGSTGLSAYRRKTFKNRWRGIFTLAQNISAEDNFYDIDMKIIDSQIDLDMDALTDPQTEKHHKQLLTKFTQLSNTTPLEKKYWQQFGYEKIPRDVAEAFHRWSLFRNKKAKKLIRKGKGKRGTKIPEVQPPNPMIYLCEKYPKCCPQKYRRLTLNSQQNAENAEFWWARGYWDGIPPDVFQYQQKFNQMNYDQKLKAMSVNQFIQMHYPDIQFGKKLLTPYFEREEFSEMLERETKKLEKKLISPKIPYKHRNLRRNLVLVTWKIVLEERKIKEEEIKKLMERKQEEKQRHKIMERFELEVQTPKIDSKNQKKFVKQREKVQNNRKLLIVKKSSGQKEVKIQKENDNNDFFVDERSDKHIDKLRGILDQI